MAKLYEKKYIVINELNYIIDLVTNINGDCYVKLKNGQNNFLYEVSSLYIRRGRFWFESNLPYKYIDNISPVFFNDNTEAELKSISCLEQPNEMLAVVKIPKESTIDYSKGSLVLDKVRDPGNLGTIIRTADWFGVQQIICSNDSVDCFNTKVIQASMGSIFRQQIVYADLTETLHKAKTLKIPVYGAYMEGAALNKTNIPPNAFIVMGNESRGISESLQPFITKKITIPKIGKAESLNVAMAATVICYEWRRFS